MQEPHSHGQGDREAKGLRDLAMDKKAPHPDSPSIDHIVPLAKGGTHTWANVQSAHFLCNCTKSDKGNAQMRLF